MNKTVTSDKNIIIPLFHELGLETPIKMRVINWHNRFDALIGTKDLAKLNAKIDYSTQTINLGPIKIHFYLEYNNKNILNENSNFTKNQPLQIPVTIENGEVLVPEIRINDNLTLPECIVEAKNGNCTIFNPFNESIDINFKERIDVEPVDYFSVTNQTETNSEKYDTNVMTKPMVLNSIRTDHLNEEEKSKIINLCLNYRQIFYHEKADLTFTNSVKHVIRTKDDNPVYVRSFRHPQSMRVEIKRQIQNLLDKKIIRPSISPYSAPVWLVDKKPDASGEKKQRLVIDYRGINLSTIQDRYPLPRIDEILDNLGRSTYFTTLDLAQGFHQIEMDPKSIEKTAFTVNNGHYEYLRMPFGLKNAPSTFQRVMDNVFRDYLYKFCFVYVDDIVIFSKSLHDHLIHVRQVFEKLKQHNLKVQLNKSEFFSKNIAFLGHVITPEGIKPNPDKIKAIQNYPMPTTAKEIKSFLGLVGYYRKFISNFSKIISPITKCLKKGSKIDFKNPDYIDAFEQCKELLTNAPILIYPDFEKEFYLTTDASNVAIGSVLSQNSKPVAYYSRTLNSAEKNYSTIEKELLAIIESTRHFRPYLFGRKFTVETDHNPLVWLYKIKEPNTRLARWKLKLDEFDFKIVYKKGNENKVADALSRIEIHNNEVDKMSTIPQIDEPPNVDELDQIMSARESEGIDDISSNNGNQNEDSVITVHSNRDEDGGKVIPIAEYPVNHFNRRLILSSGDKYEIRLKKPFKKLHYTAFIRKQETENDLKQMIKEIIQPNMTYGLFANDKYLLYSFTRLCKTNLNQTVKLVISNQFVRDIIDEESQRDIVTEYHNLTHNGINETYEQLKRKYFWPNMKVMITHEINKCELCLKTKYERNPYNVKMQGPLLARKPFDTLFMDTFSFQNSKFLTIIDSFSRYAQAYYVKDGTGLTILNKIRHYFSHHSIPKKIVCDEGKEFHNKTLIEFCKFNKIELHFTTINNPSSNSPIERLHSTLLEKLRVLKLKEPNETPQNQMISAVLIYNQSIHTSTGFSPFSILYGPYERDIEIDLDITIYEQYNCKRKNEILPFIDEIYKKNLNKEQTILDKRNASKENTPDTIPDVVFIRKNKPGKTDPLYDKIKVTNISEDKIEGISEKKRLTNSNIKKTKRIRKTVSLQDPDDNNPGQSISDPTS